MHGKIVYQSLILWRYANAFSLLSELLYHQSKSYPVAKHGRLYFLIQNIYRKSLIQLGTPKPHLNVVHEFIYCVCTYRVDDSLQVKIADFGLSRDVYESNYYVLRHAAKLPVRWMALESLLDGCFNLKSDVVR